MAALREKITAWLFVLNSCLRASNCSRRSSSPVGRLPAAGLLSATAPVQQGALRGDHSPDSPTASHRASASSTPSMAPAKIVLQAPCCGEGACPEGMATRQAPGMGPQPWGRTSSSSGTPGNLAWGNTARLGHPRCMLHITGCTLHIAW